MQYTCLTLISHQARSWHGIPLLIPFGVLFDLDVPDAWEAHGNAAVACWRWSLEDNTNCLPLAASPWNCPNLA
jgi:hypothetical protein